jgi:hypothetical protein
MTIVINIANDFSKTPGGRLEREGNYSGEAFRRKILKPAFEKSISKNETLIVNLDGGYGYAISFLEEAFGGLARETKNPCVMKIQIISEEEPALVEKIYEYMNESLKSEE